jgi:hypothetical protein
VTDYGREWQQDGRRSQVLRAVREAYSGHGLQGPDLARIGEASTTTSSTREPSVRRTGHAGGTARPDDSGILRRAVVKARVSDLGDRVACIVVTYALHGCTIDADRLIRDRGHRGGRDAFREEYRIALVRLCAVLPSDA